MFNVSSCLLSLGLLSFSLYECKLPRLSVNKCKGIGSYIMQGFLNIAFSNFCSLAYSFYLYSFFYFYYYFRTSITHRLSEESTYFFSINLISIVLLCIQILTKRGNRTRLAFYCLNFELLSSLSSQAPLFFLFLFLLSRFKRTKNPWFWDKLYIEYNRITNVFLLI